MKKLLNFLNYHETWGQFEDDEVKVGIGRFGPYIRHKSLFYSLKKDVDDPISIKIERAIEVIYEKREADKKKIIKTFKENEELRILAGRYGPYISYQKKNFRIPKTKEPESLSLDECLEIIEKAPAKPAKKRFKKSK